MNKALQYASKICYSSYDVLKFSYDSAVKYKDSPGAFVETGVAAGAQIIAMLAGAPGKTVYAFDSYDGLPLPSNKDNQMPGLKMLEPWEQRALPDPGKQALVSSGAVVVTEESFLSNVAEAFNHDTSYYKNLYPIKGWFEHTAAEGGRMIDAISILRLDGDLYNSTYVCLKHLYPKCIKGSLIIIDDFALPGCRAAVLDYWNDNSLLPLNYQSIEDQNSHVIYWTK